MPKGMFSQAFCLLTDGQPTIDDIKRALSKHGINIAKELPGGEAWHFGGPSVVIPFIPAVNGNVAVDVVNRPWPDSMGDPKTDPMVFGAWSMSQFGPFTFPGGLARAQQQSWAWADGKKIGPKHRGFIRIRCSYVFGAGNPTILLKDYKPLDEMNFLNRIAIALFNVPGVLCYFNPNGEVLRDATSFRHDVDACAKQQKLPIHLWANVRLYTINQSYSLMDTVSNAQLDVRDIEAVFPIPMYDEGTIDYYLRNVTIYLLGLDREFKSGESVDGPGENQLSWTIDALENGVASPPRPVYRLYPKAKAREIHALLSAVGK